MGSGLMQSGGIMGQLQDRMHGDNLAQKHIAGMMLPIFQKFADNGDSRIRPIFYGNKPPVASPAPQTPPQGIVSALPKVSQPVSAPTQGYGGYR